MLLYLTVNSRENKKCWTKEFKNLSGSWWIKLEWPPASSSQSCVNSYTIQWFLLIYCSSHFQETSATQCFLLIYCSSHFQETFGTQCFLSIYYSSFFQETSAIECFLLIYCSSNFQETFAIQCFFINLLFRALSGDVCNSVFFLSIYCSSHFQETSANTVFFINFSQEFIQIWPEKPIFFLRGGYGSSSITWDCY